MHAQVCECVCISRVLDQNGVSQACHIVEIYYSGLEPSICMCMSARCVLMW